MKNEHIRVRMSYSEPDNVSQFLTPGETLKSKTLDFNDAGDVMLVLEEGSAELREKLRAYKGVSKEELNLAIQFAELRRNTIFVMKTNQFKRGKGALDLSSDENKLELLLEELEPQVREAVISLNRKGYATIYSGFSGTLRQSIGFENDLPDGWQPTTETKEILQQFGITLHSTSREIIFTCSKYLNLEELKKVWNSIAMDLPELIREESHHNS